MGNRNFRLLVFFKNRGREESREGVENFIEIFDSCKENQVSKNLQVILLYCSSNSYFYSISISSNYFYLSKTFHYDK